MEVGEASLLVQVPVDQAGWLDALLVVLPDLVSQYCEQAQLEPLEPAQFLGRVDDRSDRHVLLKFGFRAVAGDEPWPPGSVADG
jgi:hypothetical protein